MPVVRFPQFVCFYVCCLPWVFSKAKFIIMAVAFFHWFYDRLIQTWQTPNKENFQQILIVFFFFFLFFTKGNSINRYYHVAAPFLFASNHFGSKLYEFYKCFCHSAAERFFKSQKYIFSLDLFLCFWCLLSRLGTRRLLIDFIYKARWSV